MAALFELTTPSILLLAALFLLGYVCLAALIGIYRQRADTADTAWGPGFSLVAWVSFLLSPFSYPTLIVTLMVTAWSLRLALHIAVRKRHRKEDFRYETLAAKGRLQVFLQVFLLQGALLYVVALPILWINTHPQHLGWRSMQFAVPIWVVGFLLETVADLQLVRFQKDPSHRGKLLTTGLWGWVRHPNYLGELLQWWVLWALCANFFLLISPLLLTFLILKVSGVAPLEKKLQTHPDFPHYAAATPSLVPFSAIQGALYTIAWLAIIYFAAKSSFFLPLAIFCCIYGLQLVLFARWGQKALPLAPLLSVYALLLGLVQETLFIHFHLLEYPDPHLFPPLWLLSLYALFGLNLSCSFSFLNKNLPLAFLLGGCGALLSYLYAEKFSCVALVSPLAYPFIILSWGLYVTALLLLYRTGLRLQEKYSDPLRLHTPLTVFFDQNCPVCSVEQKKLQRRKQTGTIIYDCLSSEETFKKKISRISYESAQKKIHALDAHGEIFSGIDALSEIYARADLLWIALCLQAPGFRPLFIAAYALWAKVRRVL